jgi:hypothetical protein
MLAEIGTMRKRPSTASGSASLPTARSGDSYGLGMRKVLTRLPRPDTYRVGVDIEPAERSLDPIRTALEARDVSVAEANDDLVTNP